VTASGIALTYKWLRNGSIIAGRTTNSLTLTNVSAADAGIYSVVVGSPCGSVTNSATLTVRTLISVAPLPNLVRFVGGIAVFAPVVTGTGPFAYVWAKDGNILSGQTGSSLVLTNLTTTNSGIYTVTVTGPCNVATASGTLTVDTCFPSVDVMLVIDRSGSNDLAAAHTVQSIKERELPAADDDFAQLASEFDTLDELRADLRERLGRVKNMQQAVQARDKVLEALLAVTEVPLPESVVDSEIEVRKHDAVHSFDHDEARFAEWLAEQDQTAEQFDADVREAAEKAVKTQLVLDSIADAESINVNDNELTERIIYQAQRFGVSPDEYVQRAQQSGQLGAIFADVRRGKALATVVRQATVTDAAGNAVDMDELFGTQVPAGTDEVDEIPAVVDATADGDPNSDE